MDRTMTVRGAEPCVTDQTGPENPEGVVNVSLTNVCVLK